jgi:hypothetical protein
MVRLALLSLLLAALTGAFGFSGYGLFFEAGRVISFGSLALALFLFIGNYLRATSRDSA